MKIIKNIFIKVVLCGLAEKGHQVIYTTHSHKMMDIFDTRGLIRLEFDEETKRTVVKYNNSKEHFISSLEVDEVVDDEIINKTRDYNNYIKIVEPKLE